MLKKAKIVGLGLLLLSIISMTGFISVERNAGQASQGAWKTQKGSLEQVLLLSDGYFMHTVFDKVNKKFVESRGGTYTLSNDKLMVKIEFNTSNKDQIGQSLTYGFAVNKAKLSSDLSGEKAAWALLDQGKGDLAGTWRISGRMQDGKIVMTTNRGARKTLKVLTGTRFQWAAINPETKEFFGTGGGSYTFVNGKYTENIEFFSRDNQRVGASLSFDGKIIDGNWHHSGNSSTGSPIYEVWSKEPQP